MCSLRAHRQGIEAALLPNDADKKTTGSPFFAAACSNVGQTSAITLARMLPAPRLRRAA